MTEGIKKPIENSLESDPQKEINETQYIYVSTEEALASADRIIEKYRSAFEKLAE